MNVKKILALVLCMVMCVSLIPTEASAVQEYISLDKKWRCSVGKYGNTLTISEYLADNSTEIVPGIIWLDKESSMPVTVIGYAFKNNSKIEIVYANNDTLEDIGPETFKNCTSLVGVTFSSHLQSIDKTAFDGVDLSKLQIEYYGNFEQWKKLAPALVPPTIDGLATINEGVSTNYYALTINYVYEDGTQAADTHYELMITQFPSDGSMVRTDYSVSSPEIAGYIPDKEVVEGESSIHNETVTVTYYTPRSVIISSTGHGYVSANVNSGIPGTEVQLSARPYPRYRFKEWRVLSGGVTVESNKFTIGQEDVRIQAVFEPDPTINYSVTVTTDGHGTASADVSSGNYDTVVNLSAEPAGGYRFKEWQVLSGNVSVENNSFKIRTNDVEIKAIFEEVDKSQLEAAITYAEGLTASDYTAGSWSAVQTALSSAKTVYAKADATQDEVDAAQITLDNAVAALVLKGDEPFQFDDVTDPTQYFYNPVYWAVENGITKGKTATSFDPWGTCMRSQIVTFLWRYYGEPEPSVTTNPFTDVKPSDSFYKAVLWAVENGITTGRTKTTFDPWGDCTRAQVVTFLWRAAGKPAPQKTASFTDLEKGAYYVDAVSWAVENGITTGTTATTFSPYTACRRAQVVTFLYRMDQGS